MINFGDYANEKKKTERNSNWPYIPDHPYRLIIIGGSGSGKNKCVIWICWCGHIISIKIKSREV